MRFLPVLLIAVVVLFLVALIAPRASRRVEHWMNRNLEAAEDKGDRRAGWLGTWTAKLLSWSQRLMNSVLATGRGLRDRLSGGA